MSESSEKQKAASFYPDGWFTMQVDWTPIPERKKKSKRFEFSPKVLQTVHGWLTILWAGLIIPAVAWWHSSVPFLVIVSVYANLAGHFAAWQAARTEVKQDVG